MSSFFIPFQSLFFLKLLLVLSPFAFASLLASAAPGGDEAEALVKWKSSLDNNSQALLSSLWVGRSHCNWTGITCDELGGNIINLNLGNYGLRGTLDSLNFHSFPHLVELHFPNNSFYGTIPSHIGNLSKLTYLDLSYNILSGSIPSEICLLRSLNWIYLERNEISGPIPQEIGSLHNLSHLFVSNNLLTGPIPTSMGNLSSLVALSLRDNRLYGIIPEEIGNLSNLTALEFRNNSFCGSIPSHIGNLTKLTYLDMSFNNLNGTIPKEVGMMRSLSMIDFSSNYLSGPIPITSVGNLRSLKITGNKLEGNLPRSLAYCTKLQVIDLGKNMIQDIFPSWLMKLPSLMVLILRANRFQGPISFSEEDEIFFPNLHILDLASNQFSGVFVGFFQSFKALRMMSTSGNKSGPNYIGDGDYYQDSVTLVVKGRELDYKKIFTTFASIDLSQNSFYGRIPEEIHNLKSLIVLNMSHNSFNGKIPSALGDLTNLESLDLSHNKLSGLFHNNLQASLFFHH